MKQVNYEELLDKSLKLAGLINADKYDSVFGIPSGGLIPGLVVAQELELPIIEKPNKKTLIVDDLIDSGKTLSQYPDNDCAVIWRKPHSPKTTYVLEEHDGWIALPHEKEETGVEDHITRLLEFVGENPNRNGLLETPSRVIKSYGQLFRGYKQNPSDMVKVFDCESYTGMVLLKDIELYSMCEHHMLPFVGKCHIAYIPDKKVIGISKLARIMEVYARRLQIQEKLTDEIADCLNKLLKPKGVAVRIEAEHMCMRMRGIGKQNSVMVTTSLRGNFLNSDSTRQEFLEAIK